MHTHTTVIARVMSDERKKKKRGKSHRLLTVNIRINILPLVSMLEECSLRKLEPKKKAFKIETQSESMNP